MSERLRRREVPHNRQGEMFCYFNPNTGQMVTFRQDAKNLDKGNRSLLLQELNKRPEEWKRISKADVPILQQFGYPQVSVKSVLEELASPDIYQESGRIEWWRDLEE
jgi:hypothetical protein